MDGWVGWDGNLCLQALILRAPLCGADNNESIREGLSCSLSPLINWQADTAGLGFTWPDNAVSKQF